MFTSTLFAIVCAATASVYGLPQPQSAGAPCPFGYRSYGVRAGDTCFTIGTQFGVFPISIMQANPAINPDCTNLQPGQTLCIPPSVGTTSSTTGA